jgi:hypothetical protein
MSRPQTIATCLGIIAWALVCRLATAAPKDAAGESADQHAMNDLFAAANYDEAKATLQKAIKACRRCSKKTKARLHADLGVVLVTGFNDSAAGQAEMAKARTLDPSVTLDPAFSSPEVQAAFAAAESGAAEEEETEEEPAAPEAGDEAAEQPRARKHAEAGLAAKACNTNTDCGANGVCRDGWCKEGGAGDEGEEKDSHGARPSPAVWLSVGLIQDFALISGSDVCTQKNQVSGGYTCIRSSLGGQYHGTPVTGQGGKLGGFAIAATRVTVAMNARVSDAISLGLRLGYAFLGQGPTPDGGHDYLALQVEAQGAYWFSRRPFATEVLGTFVELSAGLAQVDGKGSVTVTENQGVPPPVSQIDNPPRQSVDAWQKGGAAFAGAGLGMFLPFGGASGLIADLRVLQLFPSSGTAISLGVSGALGL